MFDRFSQSPHTRQGIILENVLQHNSTIHLKKQQPWGVGGREKENHKCGQPTQQTDYTTYTALLCKLEQSNKIWPADTGQTWKYEVYKIGTQLLQLCTHQYRYSNNRITTLEKES